MSVHDDAEAARRKVYDAAAAELEQRLRDAVTERDEAREALARMDGEYDTLAARVVEQESVIAALRDRIAELEKPPVPTDPAVLPGWGAPVWRDEFDGDLSQWNVRHDWLTMDTANAVRENVVVEDGVLHLLGTWLDEPEQRGPQGIITHHTGYLDTRNERTRNEPDPVHFSQPFGRWEIRCQTPTGPNTRGALAAFWLRCDSHPGEIDIMEAWGGAGPMHRDWAPWVKDSAYTTFHSSTMKQAVAGKAYRKSQFRHWQGGAPRDVHQRMVTYAFEYMPDYCAGFVDGLEVFRFIPDSPDPTNKGQSMAWAWDPDFFGSPLHMRLNLHVGPSASYWGLPDPANRQWTADPLDFAVEYVRVYAPSS